MVQKFMFGGMEDTTMTINTDEIFSDPDSFDEFRMAELYRRAADLGDPLAEYHLGRIHLQGLLVQRDPDTAAEWFRRSARQGILSSQIELARLLLDRGGAVAEKEAAEWLHRAAEAGDAGAIINLGLLYRDGRGVPRDLVQATRWFFAALGKGLGDGLHYMKGYAREMSADQFRTADRLAGGDGAWAASGIATWLEP